MSDLSPKQQSFADNYIETGNAEQSAIKAGYSKAYARGNAHKLVANSCVKKYIDERMKEIASKKIADQTEVMEFLTSIMRGEVTEPMTVLDGDGMQRVEYLIPSANTRKGAAELIGKRYSMWTDKKQIEGNIGVQIVDDLDD